MPSAHLILVILALVCLLLAAAGVTGRGAKPLAPVPSLSIDLTALGLFLWLLSTLVQG